MKKIQIAMVAHEVNRAYCQALGDNSQPAWEESPDWQRESAKQGVCFHLDNPGAGPESSHQNWLEQKIADGWKYGPVKDPETKTHPCMMPFEQLPLEQRVKDYLFQSVVHSMVNLLPKDDPMAPDLPQAIPEAQVIFADPEPVADPEPEQPAAVDNQEAAMCRLRGEING